MRLPLSDHDYGAHGVVLPPTAQDRHDGADIELSVRMGMYRKLQEMRLFEKRAYDLFMRQLVKGTSHLSLGMEAISAGFGAAMRGDDYTFATYRGHAHTLARGVPMTPVLAELLGRSNGLMGGKGGSMHLTSVEHGMMGSYAIIGAHLTIANGAAWSAQYRGSGQVAVCFFGDGTTNIGAFHEALNYAAVYTLPVVFVCENNLYMEYTAIGDVSAVRHPAADRAPAYGLDPIVIDGNDADEVYLTAMSVIERARSRRRSVAGRGHHVPPRRALPGRPRQVPAGRRGRGLEGLRPRAAVPRAPAAPGCRGGRARLGRRRRAGSGRDRDPGGDRRGPALAGQRLHRRLG